MSIFKTKEWCYHKIGEQKEEFDEKHVEVISLAFLSDPVLLVGSYSGYFRILPLKKQVSQQLLLQHNFDAPIHQIKNITKANEMIYTIAILLNSQLIICEIHPTKDQQQTFTNSIDQSLECQLILKIKKRIELKCDSFNMCLADEHIIVQSQDCRLLVIEVQMSQIVRSVQMNEVLPVLMLYSETSQSLLFYSSTYELMSLPFKNLFTTSSLLSFHWKSILNSPGQQLHLLQQSVYLLTNNSLYRLSLQGECQQQIRLGYSAIACYVYKVQTGERVVVVSEEGYLYVYGESLLWAACCEYQFVQVSVVEVGGQKGLIQGVDGDGHVQVIYLGSEGFQYTGGEQNEQVQIDYEKIQSENNEINNRIREMENMNKNRVDRGDKQQMCISVQWVKTGNEQTVYIDERDKYHQLDNQIITTSVRLAISNHSSTDMTGINVQLQLPNYLSVLEDNPCMIAGLSPNSTPYSLTYTIITSNQCTPYARSIGIQCIYTAQQGIHYCNSLIQLPYAMSLLPCLADKTAQYKVTLCTKQELPKIAELFSEIGKSFPSRVCYLEEKGHVYSFRLCDQSVCSVLLAKSDNKFRVQAGSMAGLYMLLACVCEQLDRLGIQITYNDSLPFQDYFGCLEHHYEIRQQYDMEYEQLELKTQQFRVIEKKLIMKFRETNSKGLQNMDTLFMDTYKQVILLSKNLQELQEKYRTISHQLTVINHLFILLLKLRFNLNSDCVEVLERMLLSETVGNIQGVSWEEEVYMNIGYLLRYQKDQSVVMEESEKDVMDMPKLKKIITLLFDKISKQQIMKL